MPRQHVESVPASRAPDVTGLHCKCNVIARLLRACLQAILAFEEAVSTMRVGGIRRIEVPGKVEALGYARDRRTRFTDEPFGGKYRLGPQPAELGGQRALDFVLDNETLRDFNRDLVRASWCCVSLPHFDAVR